MFRGADVIYGLRVVRGRDAQFASLHRDDFDVTDVLRGLDKVRWPQSSHKRQAGAAGALGVQLRRRLARRSSVASPSKSVRASTSSARSMSSNVFTLMTAYSVPSIIDV